MPPPVTTTAAYRVSRVAEALRQAAAERLVSGQAGGPAVRQDNARRFLAAATLHGIDVTRMWASFDAPALQQGVTLVRETALAVPGTGRTAMLFTSTPESTEAEEELAAVIDQAAQHLPGVALAQALLEPREAPAHRAFLRAGFTDVGRLAYLRRPMPKRGEYTPAKSWPEGITVTNWQPGAPTAHADLTRALENSYIDTLDCPELCGLRDTNDVIASHRGAGVFDHRYWWIIRKDNHAEGAMLFNASPDQSSVELVYLGISPLLRGKGLGRALLETGLSKLAARSETQITCAVDHRNAPALALYRALGFTVFAERIAVVRPVRTERG